jgi:hypothetical protein
MYKRIKIIWLWKLPFVYSRKNKGYMETQNKNIVKKAHNKLLISKVAVLSSLVSIVGITTLTISGTLPIIILLSNILIFHFMKSQFSKYRVYGSTYRITRCIYDSEFRAKYYSSIK